jgi:hypothetical protein
MNASSRANSRLVNSTGFSFRRATDQIQLYAAVLENRFLHSSLPPDKGTDTGQELCQVKWFGKIVVRSQIQPFDAILNRVTRT